MSTVRVWLKREIKNSNDFKDVKDVLPGKEFYGVEVKKDGNGGWYTESFELMDTLPNFLSEYVTHISLYGCMPKTLSRESGLYKVEKYGETVARVEDTFLSLKITGDTLEHVRGLHDAILAGEIRPYKSFAGGQLGLSKQELEEKVEQLESKCRSYAFFEDFFNVVKKVWLDDKRWFLNGRAFRKQLGGLIAIRPEK